MISTGCLKNILIRDLKTMPVNLGFYLTDWNSFLRWKYRWSATIDNPILSVESPDISSKHKIANETCA